MASSDARRISSGLAPAAAARSPAALRTFSIVACVGSRPRLISSSSSIGQFDRSQLGPGWRSTNPTASFNLALQRPLRGQQFLQRLAELRWAWGYGNSSRFHGRDFASSVPLAARDDRAGVAHPAARRRGAAGDEADRRLRAPALGLVGEELRSVLFGAAADLTDHDDRLRFVVGEKLLKHVDELGALHRIAADADSGRLAKPLVGSLKHGLIGQRAGAADDADAALLEDVAGHDADLALVRR